MRLTLAAWWLALHPAVQADLVKRDALSDCLTKANVPFAVSGNSNFTLESKPFNLRVPFTPDAIALPTTVAHVQSAVLCGASAGVRVSAKSGGHSYASHGLGGENGHLVIALKYMNSVTVDNSTYVASVGAGSRIGNVATALYNQGQRALSHGTCPGVGIGGLSLHGGYGYSSRLHGLTLDNLVEAQVVIANGSVVTASSTQNSDLFWAIRGAGAAFGVVTNFKFNTFAAPSSNTVFSYYYNFGSASAAASAIMALQNFANTTQPAEMNMRLFITSFSAQLEGVYYGSQTDFQTAIQPLLNQLGSGGFGSVQTMDWLGALNNYAYASLQQPVDYDTHETFFSKSLMLPGFTTAGATAFANYWYNTAMSVSRDWYCIIDCHGGPNSAITKMAPNSTAYAHRGAIFKFEFYDRVDSGTYPSDGFSFLNGWVNSVITAQPNTTMGMYINYADTTLTAAQAHQYYWLDHYSTLSNIKATWDPKNLFTNPQAVGSS